MPPQFKLSAQRIAADAILKDLLPDGVVSKAKCESPALARFSRRFRSKQRVDARVFCVFAGKFEPGPLDLRF